MKTIVTALLFLMATSFASAQEKIRANKAEDSIPNDGKPKIQKQKTITIRLSGDMADKQITNIVIDGKTIKVNGNEISSNGDIKVNIDDNQLYFGDAGPRSITITRPGNGMAWGFGGRPLLGVNGATAAKPVLGIGMTKGDEGVEISNIVSNSGADKAGLKVGDVITKIDGNVMATEMDITKFISSKKPNDEVKIDFKRDGKNKTTNAKLGAREVLGEVRTNTGTGNWNNIDEVISFYDSMRFRNRDFDALPPLVGQNFSFDNNQGVSVSGMGAPKLGLTLKEVESGEGLIVKEIIPNSPAEKSGLKAGDLITKLDDKKVNKIGQIRLKLMTIARKPVNITYTRAGKEMTTELSYPKKLEEVSF
jgi:serine protease Do